MTRATAELARDGLCFVVAFFLALLSLPALGQAAFQDEFNAGSLGSGWQFQDGYAQQMPQDTQNHASFQLSGSHLAISFAGGAEHNMWWLRQAQMVRPYLGSGVYEIKMDSSLTGDQQFGLVFQRSPGTFIIFMLYAYSGSQVYAYVERFALVDGQLYKSTVVGERLNLTMPASGPFHLRVVVADNANPINRSWTFDWSRDGSAWNEIVSGILEGSSSTQNVGAIEQVGVFAGNQPAGFPGFVAQFDHFRYYTSIQNVPVASPANVAARGGDRRVDLWWDPVDSAEQYAVFDVTNGSVQPTLLGTTSSPTFTDLNLINGMAYRYAVAATRGGVQGPLSNAVAAMPNVSQLDSLPSAGLLLALSASEMAATYADGSPVDLWPNARGPFTSAIASGSSRPTFVRSAVNGRPALRFDGSDDHLTLPGGFQDFTAGMSLYMVMRPASAGSGAKLLLLGNSGGQASIGLGRAGSTSGYQFFTSNSSGSFSWFNTSNGLVTGETAVVSVAQDPGAANSTSYAALAKNGVTLLGQNLYVPSVLMRQANYIGKSYWAADRPFQGDIAEIILYNRKLNSQEQTTVQAYLAQKYGLMLGGSQPPPLSAPSGLTATAGNASVTLGWGAVSEATGYRVYRSGNSGGPYSLIGSPSGTTYVDNAVANGTRYYYVVTAVSASQQSGTSQEVSATPSAPFNPNPALPAAGLVLALDAGTAALQYAQGTAVAQWQDASGSANHAAASGSSMPILVGNAIGGQPALRFDGIDDYLALPSGFHDFTAGMSLYVVMRPTSAPSGAKLLLLGNSGGKATIGLGRAGSTAGYQFFTTNSSGSATWFNTSNGLLTGEAALVSVVQDPGAAGSTSYASLAKNGVMLIGKNLYVPPVITRGINYIGRSYWSADGPFQGDIAEVILYARKLSAQEHAAVQSYLAQKYGIVLSN